MNLENQRNVWDCETKWDFRKKCQVKGSGMWEKYSHLICAEPVFLRLCRQITFSVLNNIFQFLYHSTNIFHILYSIIEQIISLYLRKYHVSKKITIFHHLNLSLLIIFPYNFFSKKLRNCSKQGKIQDYNKPGFLSGISVFR